MQETAMGIAQRFRRAAVDHRVVHGWSLPVGASCLVLSFSSLWLLDTGTLSVTPVVVLNVVLLAVLLYAARGELLPRADNLLSDVVVGVALVPFIILLSMLPLTSTGFRAGSHELTPLIAFLAIIGAANEELIFRGHILRNLARYSAWAAVAITSAVFGLLHFKFGLRGILYFTLVGALLGVVALRRNSVVTPLTAHVALNSIAVLAQVTS